MRKTKKNHKNFVRSEVLRLEEQRPKKIRRNGVCINCDEIEEYEREIQALKDTSRKSKSKTDIEPVEDDKLQAKYFSTPCIYFLYWKKDIVYIGQTKNLYRRLYEHYESKKRFTHFVVYKHVKEDLERITLEAALIKKHRPRLNKIHK